MPNIELRVKAGAKSPQDITLHVQDKTFEYLNETSSPEVRVSAYFDRDWETVLQKYEELFVSESCPNRYDITRITPGSKIRQGVTLPGPMKNGEQLVIMVTRRN